MQKTVLPAILAGFVLTLGPNLATAGTVTLNDWTTGNFAVNAPDGGGAFEATTVGGPLGNSSFLTFCLEFTEHFEFGQPYNYELSDRAMGGGEGGGPTGDPLDDRSRWLYYTAVTGAYNAWDATLFGGNWGNIGWYIQEAIWFIEQERDWSQIDAYSRNLVTLANSQAGSINLAGIVQVMNVTAFDGSPRQDQIVMVSVPDQGIPQLLVFAVLGTLLCIHNRSRVVSARKV